MTSPSRVDSCPCTCQAFRAVSKLKKAALTVIAQQMNEGQIKALKNVFLGRVVGGSRPTM